MWLILRTNFFWLIFVLFHWFNQIKLFQSNLNFSQLLPFFKLVKKNNLVSNSLLLSKIITFLTPKKNFQLISAKKLQSPQKLSLAVFGSFLGGKQILVIFIPFHSFDQKKWVSIK